MANLDNTSKRRSSVRILMPFDMSPPAPDGTLGQGDRQHIALSYSGILAAGAVVVSFYDDDGLNIGISIGL